MEFYSEEIQRVLIAALLGAIIGIERELSGKPAGLRTLILVSMGASLFTIISEQMALAHSTGQSDVTRIASNIVTGIGFIGAGIIFRGDKSVQGLTTAATVWIGAAIGMAVGVGNYSLAVVVTVIVWLVLVLLQKLETALLNLSETVEYKVRFEETHDINDVGFKHYFSLKGYNLLHTRYDKREGALIVHWTVRASRKKHEHAINQLLKDNKIHELTYG